MPSLYCAFACPWCTSCTSPSPSARVTGTEIGVAAVGIRFGGGLAISYVIGRPAGKMEARRKMPADVVASCRSS